ncbi:DUF4145 domain-containing protein [Nocardioides dongxiaopingii]|uniref:DUF4145 domain-containing protein n=1 Tax=Nocardioides dongxiaopingii TaxID=2576036 RepID=UPI0010C766A2|nr:DUF4145 domain-containing protein [Nocardioides dongxiaopingii]
MPKFTPPEFKSEAFHCPLCDVYADQRWHQLFTQATGYLPKYIAVCGYCRDHSMWTGEPGPVMIWPAGFGGPVAAENMPETVLSVYNEARSVINLSPRAASALLRLALEGLLTSLYPDAGNLNATIGAAKAAGLPETIVQAMDVLRFRGNASIHELNREDTPETAASLATILNLVVERLITEPKQIAEMHAKLPATVLAAIERRDASPT